AEAVVEQHRAAGEIQVRLREGDDAIGWCFHRRALGHGDIHARMRGLGVAVVDALVAEAAADAPGHGPDKSMIEVLAGIVTVARRDDEGLFTFDPCGDLWR